MSIEGSHPHFRRKSLKEIMQIKQELNAKAVTRNHKQRPPLEVRSLSPDGENKKKLIEKKNTLESISSRDTHEGVNGGVTGLNHPIYEKMSPYLRNAKRLQKTKNATARFSPPKMKPVGKKVSLSQKI